MKKNLKILSLSLASAMMALAGCNGTKGPTTSGSTSTGPTTSETSTSTGGSTTTSTHEAVKLATPVLSFTDDGITWDVVEGAVKYQLKINDGDYSDDTSFTFASITAEGTYTIKVKAIGDGVDTLDSDEASISFEAINSNVAITKTSATTAAWIVTGSKAQLKVDDGEYADTELTSYTATKAEKITVKAVGGIDKTNAKLYLGDDEKSITFIEEATDAIEVYKVGDKAAADLADDWDIKKYGNTGWEATTATITTATHYDGTQSVIKFGCWNNYTVFKYSTPYSVDEAVNELDFLVKGDGVATVKIQLGNSVTGVYMTYNLGTVENAWVNEKISMFDTGWVINYNGTNVTFDQAKQYVGMFNEEELASYFDTFSVILYGETSNGANSNVYMDDIKFVETETPETSAVQPLFNLKYYYFLKVGDDAVEVNIYSDTEAKLSFAGTDVNCIYSITGTRVVLVSEYGSSVLKIAGDFVNNGAGIKITAVSGSAAGTATGLVGQTLLAGANLTYNWPGWTSGTNYSSANWSGEMYTSSGWKTFVPSTQMNCRAANDSEHVVNLGTDGSTRNFTYAPTGGIGLTNYINIRYGHYYNSNVIKVKISVKTTSGSKIYLVGDASNFVEITQEGSNTEGNRIMKDMSLDVMGLDIASITFTTQSTSQTYLYLGAMQFKAIKPASEEPEVPVTEKLNLDWADATVGSDYNNASWTREKYTSSWEASTTPMRCRDRDGTKTINFYSGWGMDYKYTYTHSSTIDQVNNIQTKVWNNYDNSKDIKLKVYLVDTDGVNHFIKGSATDFDIIPAGAAGVDVNLDFTTVSNVAKLVIQCKATNTGGDQYLYLSGIKLGLKA